MVKPAPLTGTAYSYVRFSSARQDQGDSIRRQEALRDAWLARHPSVRFDESLTLADLGRSAFRGRHRTDDRAALAQFLRAVESGRVRPGSFLLVESLDRLTREELGDAFELILSLVNRGIRIVQLSPVESILEKPVNMTALMLAVVELSRGNSESRLKSERIGAAKARGRVAARESGRIVSSAGKAWLEVRDGRFVFKPGARETIRRIFRMATAGYGARRIAKTLTTERVPAWGRKGWYEIYVRALLRGREVLGEYTQGRKLASGRQAGEVVPGYYPAAITEGEWQAVQAAVSARGRRGGRPAAGGFVNIFGGLLWDARSGERLHAMLRAGRRMLRPAGVCRRGLSGATSFRFDPLEKAILSQLAEVDPSEILGHEDGPDEVAELAAQVTRVESQLRALADSFDDADEIPEIAAKVRAKNAERLRLVELYEEAKAKAASPLSRGWDDCQRLIETLASARDVPEARTRLRQMIGRVASRIDCIFRPAGGCEDRLALVTLWFRTGVAPAGVTPSLLDCGTAHRSFLVMVSRDGVVRGKSITAVRPEVDPSAPRLPDAEARIKWVETVDLKELRDKLPVIAPTKPK
jgi:DNA invertase Pin-like site-specific DNA recombinase